MLVVGCSWLRSAARSSVWGVMVSPEVSASTESAAWSYRWLALLLPGGAMQLAFWAHASQGNRIALCAGAPRTNPTVLPEKE